jgi:RNA polymerase sigma factor (sigma-70 family)
MANTKERTTGAPKDPPREADALARATNGGDQRAASMLLSQSMPALRHASRAIAARTMDAEDLLATALLTTWEKWTQGRGPVENAHAYITQAMRNRLRDEVRAPRSRNIALDTLGFELTLPDETERVQARLDHAIVGVAMGRLTEEQRLLLTHIVVDGEKPHVVAGHLGRSAARISSALYRAKAALRVELALECLRRACATAGCQVDRVDVALRLASGAVPDGADPVLAASRACCGCWSGVQAYMSLGGADVAASIQRPARGVR